MNVDQKIDSQSVNLDKFDKEGGSKKKSSELEFKVSSHCCDILVTISTLVRLTFTLHFKLW